MIILAPELNDRLLADFLDMESSLIVSTARVIGSFDDLLGKRIMEAENEPPVIRIEAQKISDEVIDWFWGEFYEKRKENELNEQ